MAQSHGRLVGLNIHQEKKQSLKTVPFFWTVQYGQSLRYAGFAPHFDDIIYEGDVAAGSFTAYYCLGEKVMAVATLAHDPKAAHFANLMLSYQSLAKSDALSGTWWQSLESGSILNLSEFTDDLTKTNSKNVPSSAKSSLPATHSTRK